MFSCDFVTVTYSGLGQGWYMIVPFLIFGFYLALFYVIFEGNVGESDFVRDGLILVKGHLLTTNGWKIKE